MADNQPDTLQNETENLKISILELQEKYGIGRDPLYARMRYLKIKTYKVSGKAHLDVQQVQYMDGLHEHIQQTGRMEGYPVPEASGPKDEQQPDNTTTLAVAETQQISAPPQTDYTPKGQRSQSTQQTNDINAIVQSAQNKATATLIAENVIARHYIENPDLLPDELKAKIKESGEMPSIDPFAYADSLINAAMDSINAA
ncbi:hypothetical protein H6G80_30665 [Nostoc sp. FACHB-87]|uniref:hypothetical protein n=1 Tax=Nostocaceae TaxID=1162 RepID=UPI00168284CA|nr:MULTISPECIES: hypothetical protein [Nostocaceae]MBD2458417.1 hypothetical protein [Nostoc sp. FACHB-87]MBD2479487.1 hypothetical protein [Anabaena sp. FACHB-83]